MGDDRRSQAGEDRQDAHHLVRLAAVGERDDDVVFRHHPQIAVNAFGGMQEIRGRARAREGGGNFLPDQTALPHAGNRDLAHTPQDNIDRLDELFIQPLDESSERFGLDTERPARPALRDSWKIPFFENSEPILPGIVWRKNITPSPRCPRESIRDRARQAKSLLPPPPMLEIIIRTLHQDECPLDEGRLDPPQ